MPRCRARSLHSTTSDTEPRAAKPSPTRRDSSAIRVLSVRPVAGEQRNDSAGEGAGPHVLEARTAEVGAQVGDRRQMRDGPNEIAVLAGVTAQRTERRRGDPE